jgi:uncharacterized membrane protein
MNPLNTIQGTIISGIVLAIVIALVVMGVQVNELSLIVWIHVLAGINIGIGAWLGTIMLFNVWVLIWPNQKKVLGLVEATADEIAKARRVAFLASRTNTLLSIPMLMSMVGFGHGGFFL